MFFFLLVRLLKVSMYSLCRHTRMFHPSQGTCWFMLSQRRVVYLCCNKAETDLELEKCSLRVLVGFLHMVLFEMPTFASCFV